MLATLIIDRVHLILVSWLVVCSVRLCCLVLLLMLSSLVVLLSNGILFIAYGTVCG